MSQVLKSAVSFVSLASLALFVVQTLIAPVLRYLVEPPDRRVSIKAALGPRDDPPPLSVLGRRAERALFNLAEALPVFLTVAVLLLITGRDGALAQQGALIFVISRVVYVPCYLSGVIGLRSICWMVGWIGIGMMIVSLLQ